MRHPAREIAAGFGLGWAPAAPGTVASLAALAAGARLGRALPFAALAAVVGGWWALRRLPEVALDPGWVVIDEIAGQWIAMLGVGPGLGLRPGLEPGRRPSPAGLAAAFALFRLLDIAKPGPVGWADRQRGAMGVMGDDVLAGAIAAVLLRGARRWL